MFVADSVRSSSRRPSAVVPATGRRRCRETESAPVTASRRHLAAARGNVAGATVNGSPWAEPGAGTPVPPRLSRHAGPRIFPTTSRRPRSTAAERQAAPSGSRALRTAPSPRAERRRAPGPARRQQEPGPPAEGPSPPARQRTPPVVTPPPLLPAPPVPPPPGRSKPPEPGETLPGDVGALGHGATAAAGQREDRGAPATPEPANVTSQRSPGRRRDRRLAPWRRRGVEGDAATGSCRARRRSTSRAGSIAGTR
jgi:hypothetical protein